MTSRKDRQLQQAPAIHRTGGQAVKRTEGLTPPVMAGHTSPVLQPGRPAPPVLLGCTPHITLGHSMEVPPSSSTGPVGPCEGEERQHIPEDLSLSLSVSTPFPLTYKRGMETPRKGDETPRLIFTHAHFTRDLGALFLSRPFVTPTTNLVQEHKRLELDVWTVCQNQYKPSCLSCKPSGPYVQPQNLLVSG
jgi:hypothetical protein